MIGKKNLTRVILAAIFELAAKTSVVGSTLDFAIFYKKFTLKKTISAKFYIFLCRIQIHEKNGAHF